MVGTLQIITYLLCVCLVFKGIEIFQLALTSQRTDASKSVAFIIGGIMVAASAVVAIAFSTGEIVALDEHGLPQFDALRSRRRKCSILFYAFVLVKKNSPIPEARE